MRARHASVPFALLCMLAGLGVAPATPAADVAALPLGATSTEVTLAPFEEALPPGSVAHTEGRVVYTAPFLKWLTTQGTTIHVRVLDLPRWAVARVDPSEIRTPPAVMLHESYTAVSNFTLTVEVSPGAPADHRAPLQVRACAEPNGLLEGSCGEDVIVLWTLPPPPAHDATPPPRNRTLPPTPDASNASAGFEITQDDLENPPEIIDPDREEPVLVTVGKYGALGALAGMGAFLARGGRP